MFGCVVQYWQVHCGGFATTAYLAAATIGKPALRHRWQHSQTWMNYCLIRLKYSNNDNNNSDEKQLITVSNLNFSRTLERISYHVRLSCDDGDDAHKNNTLFCRLQMHR